MATLTTTLGNVELSIDELRTLLSIPAPMAQPQPIKATISTDSEPVNTVDFRRPENVPSNSAGKVISRCAEHAGKRGRVGNCPNCVRESAEPVENAEPVAEPVQKPQNNGGYRRNGKFGQRKPATPEQMREQVRRAANFMLTQNMISPSAARKAIAIADNGTDDKVAAAKKALYSKISEANGWDAYKTWVKSL